ncbi:LpxI family protein [Undibacter mobilis]|uniref:LpxI family protein n=1 Tax=Undibacter mobilis TaxID=2292256 RepID=A0A371B153_9BRAD|nr:UDP-2,3-diacylglucosamine diphosphatase LpxI [Undibacter mobilis]RDV01234.1 LpxI family protein [Undibacter mobilis]
MSDAVATPSQGPLAMICGGGALPLAIADYVAARGRKVVLFPLIGAADGLPVENYPHHWIYIGQIGKFMRLARAEGASDVVFIGALVRPRILQTRPDLKALMIMPRVLKAFRGGDDHLLTGMARLLEDEGFHLRGAHEVAPEILAPAGVLGSVQPSEADRADIELGLDYLDAASPFDIGQAVAIANRHVLAVEAAEGTDQMLARVAELRANGRVRSAKGRGVMVKAPKRHQDRRFDLPSIGPRTVEGVAQAGLAGIAVVAGATVVAEADKLLAAADRAGIFIVSVPERRS